MYAFTYHRPGTVRQAANLLGKQEEAKLLVELGRPGTTAELAERLNVREEAVEELQAKGTGPASKRRARPGANARWFHLAGMRRWRSPF